MRRLPLGVQKTQLPLDVHQAVRHLIAPERLKALEQGCFGPLEMRRPCQDGTQHRASIGAVAGHPYPVVALDGPLEAGNRFFHALEPIQVEGPLVVM